MTLDTVVLMVSVAPGVPLSPTRRVQQQEQCVQSPHTSTCTWHIVDVPMCTRYHMHMIPGTHRYVLRNRSWLSSARCKQYHMLVPGTHRYVLRNRSWLSSARCKQYHMHMIPGAWYTYGTYSGTVPGFPQPDVSNFINLSGVIT